MNLKSVISLIGASQGIFLSILILARSKKHPSILVLGVYILLYSCGLLEIFHDRQRASVAEKILFSFIANANLLYGPLIYLFVQFLVNTRIKKSVVYHFLPFLIFFLGEVLMITGLLFIPDHLLQQLDIVFFELLVVQLLVYSIISLAKFRKIRLLLLQTYSNLHIGDINWMSALLYLVTTTYVLSFLFSHLLLAGILTDDSVFIVIQLLITLFTYALGYRMYISPYLFDLRAKVKEQQVPVMNKYVKSGLKPDYANEQLQALLKYMEQEHPYKNPELNIFDLAGRLNITRNHLTEILNLHAGKNFYEFVNAYRVEEAKRLLVDPAFSHLSIAGIGFEAGFRSSTAFHSNFKKLTGVTPNGWKDRTS